MFIGIDHDDYKLTAEVEKIFDEHSTKGTRLFIEFTRYQIKEVLSGFQLGRDPKNSPFGKAVHLAKDKGIEIIPLDKQSTSDLLREAEHHFFRGTSFEIAGKKFVTRDYIMRTVRERGWKGIIKRRAKKK